MEKWHTKMSNKNENMKKILTFIWFFIPTLFLLFFLFNTKDIFAAGTSYTDVLGNTHYSDGSSSYTDVLGNTHFNFSDGTNGTAYTDVLGNTHYNGGSNGANGTSYTDVLGNTHFNFSDGTNGTAYTDVLGNTHYNDNKGNIGSSYTDVLGNTHYSGDIFIEHKCPANSSYDSLSGNCKCSYNYESNGSSCVYKQLHATMPTCPANSYFDGISSCKCNIGYIVSGSSCVYKNTNIITPVVPIKTNDQICQDSFGSNVDWDGTKDSNGYLNCNCKTGYRWNSDKTKCLIEQNNNIQNTSPLICKANSIKVGSACVCNEGYIMVGTNCISHTENCKKYYGQNVYGTKGNDNNSNCYCNFGYDWDSNRKNCIKQISVIEKEKNSTGKIDKNLSKKLNGTILIQNEEGGTMWYVNPKDSKRYIINSGPDLLNLVQKTGKFANNKLMASYKKNPKIVLGNFVIDTKSWINYYVNPKDKKFYEINDTKNGFTNYSNGLIVLRKLGTNISNNDIRKIEIGN